MVTTDLYGEPFQLKFVRPAQMLLFAKVACDPPLGQATVVPFFGETVQFTVLLESSKTFPEQPWEAIIWHNAHENGEWNELRLQEQAADTSPLAVGSATRAKVYRRYFSTRLPIRRDGSQTPIKFTLKYRMGTLSPWKWVNDNSSLTDGELYFQPQKPPSELKDYLKDISPDLAVQTVPNDTPETQLWSITTAVKGAEGTSSGWTTIKLGTPRSFTRWFSLVRIWTPWLAPRHGKGNFSPTEDGVLASFLRWDGLHLVILAVSGVEDVVTVFKPDGEGNVMISARNDRPESSTAHVIAAVGTTFDEANAAVMYHARKIVQGDEQMSIEIKQEVKSLIENDVKAEWMENWYDGLTYCTWNALGQDLNEDKIYNALNILKDNNVQITNLIIDDNWQSLDAHGDSQFQRGWTRFEANAEGFPHGLKHTVTNIRDQHPNIEHIAVWHALAGYWGAVSPSGEIASNYKTINVHTKSNFIPREMLTIVDPDDINRMYNDFYKFLLESGVDSVKTDVQFMFDLLADAPDRVRTIAAFQDAWTINSLRYFSIKSISCMSLTPQNIFHTMLPLDKPRMMVRNSDDFFPDIPNSHPWHIFVNAHNSLLTSHLNILPDWDMFQTSHPYSSFHAAGRCVSGGPIYITDEPGHHNLALIAEMTAQTTKGKTIILRPSVIGKTVGIYTAYEEERLLKVGTFVGGTGGTGILALFNVSQRPLSELVNISSFPGIVKEQEYIIHSHTTGEVSQPMSLDNETPIVSVEAEVKGYEILSAIPLQTVMSTSSSSPHRNNDPIVIPTKVGVLGLLGKMTGAAAVLSTSTNMTENGRGKFKIEVVVKALGILGVYIDTLNEKSIEDDILITMVGKVIPVHTVTIDKDATVLKIDVATAWREMCLEPGWSNEVGIEIFLKV